MIFTRNQNKIKFIYYKLISSLTLQFLDSDKLNHPIFLQPSLKRGARVHKATEMSPFLLSVRELEVLHLFHSKNEDFSNDATRFYLQYFMN